MLTTPPPTNNAAVTFLDGGELPPTPPPLVIVEDEDDGNDDGVEEIAMSIEETGAVDDPLGATSSSEMTPLASEMTPLAFKDISKAKGISKSTVAREINFDNYQRALDNLQPQRHTVRRIKSDQHALYLEETHKSSIHVADSKRFWISKYQSLAFGNTLTRGLMASSASTSTSSILGNAPDSAEEEEQLD